MRRYLVFTYYVNRPMGGYNDFLDSFSSISEALENLYDEPNRFYQVIDRNSMKVVKQGLTACKDDDKSEFRREDSV